MCGLVVASLLMMRGEFGGEFSQQAVERRSSLTGDVRHHRAFPSELLENERDLIVYLPPGYEGSGSRKFPVVYMHDGQNVMDGMTSYIPNEEWRADESAEGLIRAGLIEPVVIVGVANAGARRADEFLPTRSRRGETEMGGMADSYGRFLTEEVMPFIEKTYRVESRAGRVGLVGSSFGGIVTLHLGMTRPEKFGVLGVFSPSLWWDGEVMARRAEALAEKPAVRMWVDMGTMEGPLAVPQTDRLVEILREKGFRDGREFVYYVDHHAQHNERAWAGRFDLWLQWAFGRG